MKMQSKGDIEQIKISRVKTKWTNKKKRK